MSWVVMIGSLGPRELASFALMKVLITLALVFAGLFVAAIMGVLI